MQGEDEVARLREENEQLRAVRHPSISVPSLHHRAASGCGKPKFSGVHKVPWPDVSVRETGTRSGGLCAG